MSSQELWQWVHQMYGDELGLTSSDDDYVPPPSIDEFPLPLDSSVNSQDAKVGPPFDIFASTNQKQVLITINQ